MKCVFDVCVCVVSGPSSQCVVCRQPRGHRLQLHRTLGWLRHQRGHGFLRHVGAARTLLRREARVPGNLTLHSWRSVLCLCSSGEAVGDRPGTYRSTCFSPQNVPFYIFSESYGGKMAAAISLDLTKVTVVVDIKSVFFFWFLLQMSEFFKKQTNNHWSSDSGLLSF